MTITTEALEAAAQAIANLMEDPEGDWTGEARAALEAAAPHLAIRPE